MPFAEHDPRGTKRQAATQWRELSSNSSVEATMLGISHEYAGWLIRQRASTISVHMSNFEEGSGRIMCVVGSLECDVLFLGPHFKFVFCTL